MKTKILLLDVIAAIQMIGRNLISGGCKAVAVVIAAALLSGFSPKMGAAELKLSVGVAATGAQKQKLSTNDPVVAAFKCKEYDSVLQSMQDLTERNLVLNKSLNDTNFLYKLMAQKHQVAAALVTDKVPALIRSVEVNMAAIREKAAENLEKSVSGRYSPAIARGFREAADELLRTADRIDLKLEEVRRISGEIASSLNLTEEQYELACAWEYVRQCKEIENALESFLFRMKELQQKFMNTTSQASTTPETANAIN